MTDFENWVIKNYQLSIYDITDTEYDTMYEEYLNDKGESIDEDTTFKGETI